jgi:pimeloyl-ACP methyl ester carboxylesterase
VKDHTVIFPDLRGMGLSSHQDGGYEKTAQARDLAGILDKLGVQNVAQVTHVGNMVGYALAALYPARVTRWVVMDAPLPGICALTACLSSSRHSSISCLKNSCQSNDTART